MGISAGAAVLIAMIAATLVTAEIAYTRDRHRRRAKKARKAAEALFAEDHEHRRRSKHARDARRKNETWASEARCSGTTHSSAKRTNKSVSTPLSNEGNHQINTKKTFKITTSPNSAPTIPSPDRTGKKPRNPRYFGYDNLTESEREYWARQQRYRKDAGTLPKPVTVAPEYMTAEMCCNGVVVRDFAYEGRC